MDTDVPVIATEDQIVEDYESDYDGLADVVAECEAASDCSFLDAEGNDAEVITAWTVGSMEKNVAYIGMILLPLSILALIGKATGLLKIERLTPTIAGVALVGFFWIDTILWNTVTHAGISLEELSPTSLGGNPDEHPRALRLLRPKQSELRSILHGTICRLAVFDQGQGEKGGASSAVLNFTMHSKPIIR